MKQTIRTLATALWGFLTLYIGIVAAHETDLLHSGVFFQHASLIYAQFAMQLLTLAAIPLALYMFRFGGVHRQLTKGGDASARNLKLWGLVRMMLLCIPMIINVLLYYLYAKEVSFFYLSVILLLSLVFIYPSRGRCERECNAHPETENKKDVAE